MLRELTIDDRDAVLAVVDGNKTFQRRPMSDKTHGYLVENVRRTIGFGNHLYFGDVDADGDLLSWVHFELWDPSDEPAFFQGLLCTTNSKSLAKVTIKGRPSSQTVLDLVGYSYARLAQLGLKIGYSVAPLDPQWVTNWMILYSDAGRYWSAQKLEEVAAGGRSIHPLLNRYIFKVRWPNPQIVSRLTKKEENCSAPPSQLQEGR
jgi:hypothetical protein